MVNLKSRLPGYNKKTKSSKLKHASASPLMADEPKASSSSSASRLQKDKERASQRKEREERRKKRDDRIADSNASKASSKKTSKPKLSRDEQDAKDANLGCCHKFQQFLVKLVHVLDALIGLTFVIYGSLIMTQFKNPATEAGIITLTYGSAMLFTSIMGVVGFYSTMCKRVGLAISAYMAPLIALFYVFAILSMLTGSVKFFKYLTDNKDVLYLDDAEILMLTQIMPFFYIVLASLTAIEIIRCLLLHKLRAKLIKFDSASQRILSSNTNTSSSSRKKSKKKSKQDFIDTDITEPLLLDEEQGGVGDC